MLTKRNNGSSTKTGPGRLHCDGIKKAANSKSPGGSWLGQRTNDAANARRAVKEEIGERQYRKQCKAMAALAREVTA